MASAAAAGMMGGNGCAGSSTSWFQIKNRRKKNNNDKMGRDRVRIFTAASYSSPSVMDPYKTLRIQPGASESEVRKAFRQLALQYHPDVCRGSNCGVQFSLINEAYDDMTTLSCYHRHEQIQVSMDGPLVSLHTQNLSPRAITIILLLWGCHLRAALFYASSFSSRDNFCLTGCFFLFSQTVMSNLREEPDESSQMYMSYEPSDQGIHEPMRGMDDPDWDMWEEWMGWEGAGILDYSSHVNPYI